MTTLDPTGLQQFQVSHALSLGVFDVVNGHEPKSAPGNGLTGALWLARMFPVSNRSGQATTSICTLWTFRAFRNMLAEPQDATDPAVLSAIVLLLASYFGDLTPTNDTGGVLGEFDPRGIAGTPFDVQAGYVSIGDKEKRMFRTLDLTTPVITDDVFTEVP